MRPSQNNSWKRLQQISNNLKSNEKEITNKRKPANFNNTNSNNQSDLNWDEIESTDAESLRSESDLVANKQLLNKPKLYTFYDYTNKKQTNIKQFDQTLYNNQLQKQTAYLQEQPTFYKESNLLTDSTYLGMPISSGFGGYTNTTRRKAPAKVLN